MTYEGYFSDIENNNKYYVKIGNGIGVTREIQENNINLLTPDEIICFSGNEPVTITYDMSDTFSHVYVRNCTINLVSNYDVRKYLVADTYDDVPVEIRMTQTGHEPVSYSDWTIIFSGYVQPLSFNQPFAKEWNEFALECVDKLGILEYQTFHDKIESYFYNYYSSLETVPSNINELVDQQVNTYRRPIGTNTQPDNIGILDIALYDLGFSSTQYNIEYDYTQTTKVNPVIFYGESEDDYMSCMEVIEEIGKIYGVYIWQNSDYVRGENVLLMDLTYPYEVQMNDYRGDDANISVDEAYKLIKCTVDISTLDSNFVNPFDDELFSNLSVHPSRVLTEIFVDDEKKKLDNFNSFRILGLSMAPYVVNWHDQIASMTSSGNLPQVYDHYCYILKNDMIDFGEHSYLTDGGGLDSTKSVKYTLDWLKNHPGKGALLAFCHTDNVVDQKNKANIKLKDFKNALYIQVGGHGVYNNYTPQQIADERDRLEDQFYDNAPICTIKIPYANLIPNDRSTTNYLVINGKIKLNPLQPKTGLVYDDDEFEQYYEMSQNTVQECLNRWEQINWNNAIWTYTGQCLLGHWATVKDKRSYYQNYTWNDIPEGLHNGQYLYWPWNQDPVLNQANMFMPDLVTDNKYLTYKCSSYMNTGEAVTTDNVQKLALIACRFKIGDKYLCEDFSVYGNVSNWNLPYSQYRQALKWLTAEEATAQGLDTFFTIGINPAIDDNILGKEFDIEDTVRMEMMIEGSGFAIPIPYDTKIAGEGEFSILGPYNAMWTYANKVKHGALWWKSYESQEEKMMIMSFVENIIISDFKIELYSDNGGAKQQNTDNDLVYYSVNNETYQNEEEFSCSFCTALTTQEVNALGIEYNLNNCTIVNASDNTGWYGMKQYKNVIYSQSDDNYIKLEEARVSEQYNIWQKPRNIIELTLRIINPERCNDKTNFTFTYLPNSVYRILSKEINLKENKMKCKMKDYS